MKPCFGYIRVSTQKQGEGVSLEAQKDAITVFASRNQLEVIEWFEEKETAAKSGRPVFTKMLKRLHRGNAEGLIIHKIDRSARNLRDWAAIGDLSDAGINVYFATETLDFRSRGGRLTADIQAVIAADYIRNLREETIKGMTGRLKQGFYPFRAPIGYLDNGKGKPKTPDPVRAPLITELFELYGSGQYSERSLLQWARARGLYSRSSGTVSLHGIETILGNSFYCGIITIKRTGARFDGLHQPLIEPSLFNRVQRLKAGRAGKKETRHNHLFQGVFRCGHCSGPMVPERQKGHVYYRCQRPDCVTKTIREEALNAVIAEALSKLQYTEACADALSERWKNENFSAGVEAQRSSIKLRIADETKRLERLTDLVIDGTIVAEVFNERQGVAKLRIAELRETLEQLPDPSQIIARQRTFLELMKSLTQLYELADPRDKRQMLKNCFSNLQVVEKSIALEPCNWLTWPEFAYSDPSGDPERHTYRTAFDKYEEPAPSQEDTLLELFRRYLAKP